MQGPCSEYSDTCSTNICQSVDVSLPISIAPEVKIGKVKIVCCNEPIAKCCQSNCNPSSCDIIVSQTISYKIPIKYSIKTDACDAICECRNRNSYG